MSITPEKRLTRAKISLMRNPKFALWSGILMVGKTYVSKDVPTAMTNGRDEWYGEDFIAKLNDKQLAFVVLHENLHKAYRHLFIWRRLFEENPQLCNAAADFVINLELKDMDPDGQVIEFPTLDGKKIGLVDEKYRGMNTKQVFDALKKEFPPQSGGGKGKKGDGSGDPSSGNGGPPQGFDEHDWEGAEELTEKEKKEVEREIDTAIRTGQIAHQRINGQGAGGMSRELGDLLEPQVPWQELLREFVTSVCAAKDASSWRRPNRRFLGSDTYMPTLIGERVGRICVGIDTSGSIGVAELNTFLSEVKSICESVKPEFVDVIYWDYGVASHEEYPFDDLDNLVAKTQPKGGGGTDIKYFFDYVKEKELKPQACINFTDGYTPWPEAPDYPSLFCITTDIVAPFGKTIKIEVE